MSLNKKTLWIGIFGLIVLHLFMVEKEFFKISEDYILVQSAEAVWFSAVILLALGDIHPLHWVTLLPLSAVANVLILFLLYPSGLLAYPLTFILSLPLAQLDPFDTILHLVLLPILASLSAALFCLLLHLIAKPAFFTKKTYAWVALPCFFSAVLLGLGFYGFNWVVGLPLFFAEHQLFVHKSLWFMLFGWGLQMSFSDWTRSKRAHSHD